ncbi:Ig domain-containing protein, partial [Ensifer sp. M14]|uniref:Ig domain-containing protein n=1 Tax=Ensifer sp. M14 TaxID=2203782 RepID=UPI001A7E1852
ASGGTAPYSYAITAGALPAGLTLSPGGAVSGTPTTGGAFSFTVTATDAYGATGSRAYSGTVASQLPVVGAVSATVAANSSANPMPPAGLRPIATP